MTNESREQAPAPTLACPSYSVQSQKQIPYGSGILSLPVDVIAAVLDLAGRDEPRSLLRVQRVCQCFRAVIQNVASLQRAVDEHLRSTLFVGYDWDMPLFKPEVLGGCPSNDDRKRCVLESRGYCRKSGQPLPAWWRPGKAQKQWLHSEASWRSMLVSHQNIKRVTLLNKSDESWYPRRETLVDVTEFQFPQASSDESGQSDPTSQLPYFTMGHYFDILTSRCRECFHGHGSWTLHLGKSARGLLQRASEIAGDEGHTFVLLDSALKLQDREDEAVMIVKGLFGNGFKVPDLHGCDGSLCGLPQPIGQMIGQRPNVLGYFQNEAVAHATSCTLRGCVRCLMARSQ